MANDTEFEALLDQVQNGSTFEALRAATQLKLLSRQRRKSADALSDEDILRDVVKAAIEAGGHKDVDEIVRDFQERARSSK